MTFVSWDSQWDLKYFLPNFRAKTSDWCWLCHLQVYVVMFLLDYRGGFGIVLLKCLNSVHFSLSSSLQGRGCAHAHRRDAKPSYTTVGQGEANGATLLLQPLLLSFTSAASCELWYVNLCWPLIPSLVRMNADHRRERKGRMHFNVFKLCWGHLACGDLLKRGLIVTQTQEEWGFFSDKCQVYRKCIVYRSQWNQNRIIKPFQDLPDVSKHFREIHYIWRISPAGILRVIEFCPQCLPLE